MDYGSFLRKTVIGIILTITAQYEAQGTTYLSTLSQPDSMAGYGVDESDSWGQSFITGSNPTGYNLNSVTINAQSSADFGTFQLSLYSDSGGLPGTNLASLSGASPGSTRGNYTFTASSLPLTANTQYWIVAIDEIGSNVWFLPTGNAYTATSGWAINSSDEQAFSPDNGASWTGPPVGNTDFFFAVDATSVAAPVPEPATWTSAALIGASLCAFAIRRAARR